MNLSSFRAPMLKSIPSSAKVNSKDLSDVIDTNYNPTIPIPSDLPLISKRSAENELHEVPSAPH